MAFSTYFVAPVGVIYLLVDPVLRRHSARSESVISCSHSWRFRNGAGLMFFFTARTTTEAKPSNDLAATAVVVRQMFDDSAVCGKAGPSCEAAR
ncbi:MAG: hypothetical protein R2682_14065 [Pyrinomonadaceae bacterium]